MDRYDIDSIRNPSFREARRGWDRREVQKFLDDLADWLEAGAADEARSYAVQQKLERAGQTTARILSTAEEEAENIRQEAKNQAQEELDTARTSAQKTTDEARSKARRTVEEGEARRKAIETVISDLLARRDSVLDDIERLSGDLGAAIATYRGAPLEGEGRGKARGKRAASKEEPKTAEEQVEA